MRGSAYEQVMRAGGWGRKEGRGGRCCRWERRLKVKEEGRGAGGRVEEEYEDR
jgi:hypothetical protein